MPRLNVIEIFALILGLMHLASTVARRARRQRARRWAAQRRTLDAARAARFPGYRAAGQVR